MSKSKLIEVAMSVTLEGNAMLKVPEDYTDADLLRLAKEQLNIPHKAGWDEVEFTVIEEPDECK